jgi:hypothetical protein
MKKPDSLFILDRLAKLMDAQFRIPGTEIRFGLDPLIGLIPGVGDFSTFLVSGFMVMTLAEKRCFRFFIGQNGIKHRNRCTFRIYTDHWRYVRCCL